MKLIEACASQRTVPSWALNLSRDMLYDALSFQHRARLESKLHKGSMLSTLLAFNASLFLEPFIPAVSSGLVHLSPPIPHTASRCLSLSKRCIQSFATGYKLQEACLLRFRTRRRTCKSFGVGLPAGLTALDDEDYMLRLLFACVGGNVWCP